MVMGGDVIDYVRFIKQNSLEEETISEITYRIVEDA